MKFACVCAASALLALSAHAYDFAAGSIRIDRPWSRQTAPNAAVGAGYVTIKNYGKAPDRLVAIKSAIAEKSEIHTMTMEGGVMRMRELASGLTIPAGAEVKLQPGAEHIMFMGLAAPIKQGEDFKATFVFERAGEVDVAFQVEAPGAKPPSTHDHH
jgi:hypothetical protein